jgi:ATP-dependent Clp protease ATP-binding subunit ClpB
VELQIARLRRRLEDRKIEFSMTDAARDFIAGEAYDPVYGARPLKRYVQQYVETPLARELVAGNIRDGKRVTVEVRDGELAFATN